VLTTSATQTHRGDPALSIGRGERSRTQIVSTGMAKQRRVFRGKYEISATRWQGLADRSDVDWTARPSPHGRVHCTCPLSREKQTWRFATHMSPF